MNIEIAQQALSEAVDGLLKALVALDGLEVVEVPCEALDAALGQDEAHLEARVAFAESIDELRGVVGDVHLGLMLRVEERATALAVAASDVAFRLGLAMAAKTLGH